MLRVVVATGCSARRLCFKLSTLKIETVKERREGGKRKERKRRWAEAPKRTLDTDTRQNGLVRSRRRLCQ